MLPILISWAISRPARARPARTQSAGANIGSGQKRPQLRPGDTLSKISQEFYGDPNQYMKIFAANQDKLP